MKENFLNRSWPALLLILLVGAGIYANTFQVPFVFDDKSSIVHNINIRSLDNLSLNASPNRTVAYLTFALNYHFGGLEVSGYHLVNLLIHLGAALLVYALVRLTFRTPQLRASRLAPWAGLTALLAALIFVSHPVQTQAVTYIVQRIASLATLFYLLSVVLYVWARLRMEAREQIGKVPSVPAGVDEHGDPPSRPGAAVTWWPVAVPVLLLTGSVLAAILAMKTKEIAFTLPLALVLYEFFFFRGQWRQRLVYLLPLLATLPIVPLSTLASSESASELFSDLDEQTRAHTDMGRFDYLFTQFRVMVTYLRLLILPINQNLDYDYPIYTNFFTPPVMLSFLLLGTLLALAVYIWFRSQPVAGERSPAPQPSGRLANDPALRLVSFGILWFFLTLAVESSLIPIADVIFEHRLYLPSVGALAALATIFLLLMSDLYKTMTSRFPLLVISLLILSLAGATWQRNQVWGDDIRLWQDTVNKSPNKVRPYNNLGVALTDADRPWVAIEVLSLAIKVEPFHPHAYNNLGRAYIMVGQHDPALQALQMALRLHPDYDTAFINLAALYNLEGRFHEAVSLLEQKMDLLQGRPRAHFQLGVAYASLGNKAAARQQLAVVSRIEPDLAPHLAGLLH